MSAITMQIVLISLKFSLPIALNSCKFSPPGLSQGWAIIPREVEKFLKSLHATDTAIISSNI